MCHPVFIHYTTSIFIKLLYRSIWLIARYTLAASSWCLYMVDELGLLSSLFTHGWCVVGLVVVF